MTDQTTAPPAEGLTVLVVGAAGSIGRRVVSEAITRGHRVRTLVPSGSRASGSSGSVVVGDLTDASTLGPAIDRVDAIVFADGVRGAHEEALGAIVAGGTRTTGGAQATGAAGAAGHADSAGPAGPANPAGTADYRAVLNVLTALDELGGRATPGNGPVRIALLTSIEVTERTPAHDWLRRRERLVRASGHPYTIVRPGRLGDDRHGRGTDIAEILVASLTSSAAEHKTIEILPQPKPKQPGSKQPAPGQTAPGQTAPGQTAPGQPAPRQPAPRHPDPRHPEPGHPEPGHPHPGHRDPRHPDLDPFFAAAEADPASAFDGVHDVDDLPLYAEPPEVLHHLRSLARSRSAR